jgi:signal transduction histidine kinase
MTAHGTIETAVTAVQRGAFDYLTKPFLRDELRAKIVRALASRRWARDRERLLAVGQTLASSGIMARVLDAVAQGAVETTEAERCVVFQQDHGRLVPMASAGSPPPSWPAHRVRGAAAMARAAGDLSGSDGRGHGRRPLVVQRGPAGARRDRDGAAPSSRPTTTSSCLALFSLAGRGGRAQHARAGAAAQRRPGALGAWPTEVAHELKNPLAGLRLYARHLERGSARTATPTGRGLAQKITSTVDHLPAVCRRSPRTAVRPSCTGPTACTRSLDECLAFAQAKCETEAWSAPRLRPALPDALLDSASCARPFLNLVLNGMEALTSGVA